jgi:hypothetical protein
MFDRLEAVTLADLMERGKAMEGLKFKQPRESS